MLLIAVKLIVYSVYSAKVFSKHTADVVQDMKVKAIQMINRGCVNGE